MVSSISGRTPKSLPSLLCSTPPQKKNHPNPNFSRDSHVKFSLQHALRNEGWKQSSFSHLWNDAALLSLILLPFSFFLPLSIVLIPFVFENQRYSKVKMRQFYGVEDIGVLSILTYLINVFCRFKFSVHDYISLPFNLQLKWNCCERTIKAVQLLTFSPNPLTEYCQQWSSLFTLAALLWNWQWFSFLYDPFK